MAREFQVYQGAAPQSAPVSGQKVPYFGGIPQNGAAVDAAIGEVQELGVKIGRLHDLGLQQRVTQERDRIRTEMDVEMKQAAAVAWGSEESLFRKDGSVNSDRYDAIVAKYWGQAEAISPGDFALGENAVRFAGEQEQLRQDIALGMMKFAAQATLDNTRKAFADNLQLATAKEDWEAARGLVEDARGSLLNDTEAELELLKLGRGKLRAAARTGGFGSPASVNVDGTEYSGLSAALAMAKKRGNSAAAPPEPQPLPTAETPAETPAEPAAPTADDMGPTLTLMPQEELDSIVTAFADDTRVLSTPRADGGVQVSCPAYAPECVQRVAAVGNAHGGIDAQQARMMITRIALDTVFEDPTATGAEVIALFDKSGIYEAMGDGDAAVGKARAAAIAEECVARGRADTSKLSMGAIKPIVEAHLRSPEFLKQREWSRFETLNPGLDDEDDDWADRDDPRWHQLKEYYYKHRTEYNPGFKAWDDHDDLLDEYEEHAQRFFNWYTKNKLKDIKEADIEAARDWYTMHITSRLREKLQVDSQGSLNYEGYASDLQLVRAALRESPPARLGAEELIASRDKLNAEAAGLSHRFRQAAAKDYTALHSLKEQRSMKAQREEKAKKQAEGKAAREAKKRDEAQEKAAAKEAARKLHVARSTPTRADWQWDAAPAADGAVPQCSLPESEYNRLQSELGFDGSQLVYLQVNGARILVTGVSKNGKLQLNAPAVAKVQKKPNAKKGESWKTNGNLEFSYYFKSTEAK